VRRRDLGDESLVPHELELGKGSVVGADLSLVAGPGDVVGVGLAQGRDAGVVLAPPVLLVDLAFTDRSAAHVFVDLARLADHRLAPLLVAGVHVSSSSRGVG
jgi:hypothetical protein